jgi:uncharacterized protein
VAANKKDSMGNGATDRPSRDFWTRATRAGFPGLSRPARRGRRNSIAAVKWPLGRAVGPGSAPSRGRQEKKRPSGGRERQKMADGDTADERRAKNGLRLIRAARDGDLETIQSVLAGPDAPGVDTRIEEVLEEAGESLRDPNNGREQSFTPLMIAMAGGHAPCAEWLAERAGHSEKNMAGISCLEFAAIHGMAGVAEILMRRGADPAEKDRFNRTALMMAAEHGSVSVIRALLKNGAERADFDAVFETSDGMRHTALDVAAERGQLGAAQALLPAAGKEAIEAAFVRAAGSQNTRWANTRAAVVDEMAFWVSPSLADETFKENGAKMPRWAAEREARALREAVEATRADLAGPGGAPAAGESAESAAPKRRL